MSESMPTMMVAIKITPETLYRCMDVFPDIQKMAVEDVLGHYLVTGHPRKYGRVTKYENRLLSKEKFFKTYYAFVPLARRRFTAIDFVKNKHLYL